MSVIYYFSISIYLLICLLLTVVVLMQESKSSGLGASFGGDPTQSVFGTSTADVMKKFTGWLAVGFLAFAVLLSIWTSHLGRGESTVLPINAEQISE